MKFDGKVRIVTDASKGIAGRWLSSASVRACCKVYGRVFPAMRGHSHPSSSKVDGKDSRG